MSSKTRQQKQDDREIKRFNDIISGRVKVADIPRPKKPSQANRIGGGAKAEEKDEMAGSYMRLLRILMPGMLASISRVDDYRSQRRITHTLPVIILYGLLIFLCHIKSRRGANREIGGSELAALMKEIIPDFVSIPHADTLERLMERISADDLESRYEEIITEFIKSDEFRKLNPGLLKVAIDGTQKFSRDYCWDENALSRNAGDPDVERYYAYMLESVLILENGMVLPLLTETLENGEKLDSNGKQDCETKAFKRLTNRLVKLLGKGCVTVLVDGLYASGPVISICQNYCWQYLIALKADCLTSVWDDFYGLQKIESDNELEMTHGERYQLYRWSNGIEYTYGNNHKRLALNVVTCKEIWEEKSPVKNKPKLRVTEYAWLSSSEITPNNAFKFCSTARSRWRIENHFLVTKHQGYYYEHCLTYNWNAMKAYHCLMKVAFMLNCLISNSQLMTEYVAAEGKRWMIEKVWNFLIHHSISDIKSLSEPDQSKTNRHRSKIRFKDLKLTAA